MASEDCSVCAEKYTSVVRTKICCGYCSYSACKTCVTRYLLSQAIDAHCMNCRTGWNREFIDIHMTKAFRTGAWKEHRKKMIVNREKAILPNFQRYAAAKKSIAEIAPKMREASKIYEEIESKKNTLNNNIYMRFTRMINSNPETEASLMEEQERDAEKLSKTIMEHTKARLICNRITNEFQRQNNIYNNIETKKEVEKREFIMKCVKDGCRGFLSQSYKCELCSTYVCKDCMIPKNEKNDESHVCKKDDVDTMSLIRKETRPCPKCGIRISKIDGCDQMWCTAADCGTAFSWISGKVISGVIHNPHYYEWLRRSNNNGEAPRNPGEILCGGLPPYHAAFLMPFRTLGLIATATNSKPIYTQQVILIAQIHACLTDLEYVRMPHYNTRRDADMLKELHVNFLLNEIDEDKWSQSIYLKENNLEKKQMIGQVIQTFYNAGADMMRNLVALIADMQHKKIVNPKYIVDHTEMFEPIKIIIQFNELRKYINESFEKLAETANCAVPQFDDSWRWQPAASLERIRATKEIASKIEVKK